MKKKIIVSAFVTFILYLLLHFILYKVNGHFLSFPMLSLMRVRQLRILQVFLVPSVGRHVIEIACFINILLSIFYSIVCFFMVFLILRFSHKNIYKKIGYLFLELITLTAVLDIISTILLLFNISIHASNTSMLFMYWISLITYILFLIDFVYIICNLFAWQLHTYKK